MVKLVAENDPKQLAKNKELDKLELILKKLTANVLRVSRGAGKPYDIGPYCYAVVKVFESYKEVFGFYPASEEITAAMKFKRADQVLDADSLELERIRALDKIKAGAFQLVASEMLKQNTQITAGETELFDGIRALEEVQEKYRKLRVNQTRKNNAAIAREIRALHKAKSKKNQDFEL